MQSAEPHASYKGEPAYGYNEVQGNLPQHNQGAYTPAPYNQGHYVQHSRPEVPFKRGWHITKIVLLSFSLIFSVVVIAVTASGAAHSMPRRAGLLMLCTVPQVCVDERLFKFWYIVRYYKLLTRVDTGRRSGSLGLG